MFGSSLLGIWLIKFAFLVWLILENCCYIVENFHPSVILLFEDLVAGVPITDLAHSKIKENNQEINLH